mmetsp:Transcript_45564/g.132031  ORF Transcript_45564/g.132031 Transcript_45564/m.132031 type:complete len:204 (-) Transcript_45564:272-883(-)
MDGSTVGRGAVAEPVRQLLGQHLLRSRRPVHVPQLRQGPVRADHRELARACQPSQGVRPAGGAEAVSVGQGRGAGSVVRPEPHHAVAPGGGQEAAVHPLEGVDLAGSAHVRVAPGDDEPALAAQAVAVAAEVVAVALGLDVARLRGRQHGHGPQADEAIPRAGGQHAVRLAPLEGPDGAMDAAQGVDERPGGAGAGAGELPDA